MTNQRIIKNLARGVRYNKYQEIITLDKYTMRLIGEFMREGKCHNTPDDAIRMLLSERYGIKYVSGQELDWCRLYGNPDDLMTKLENDLLQHKHGDSRKTEIEP